MEEVKPYWLFSDQHFADITNGYEWDVFTEMLNENGITCKQWADTNIYMDRFPECDNLDCPYCGESGHYPNERILAEGEKEYEWKCVHCEKQFDIATGTFADVGNVECYEWWRITWIMCNLDTVRPSFISDNMKIDRSKAIIMLDAIKTSIKRRGKKGYWSGEWKQHEILELLFTLKYKAKIVKEEKEEMEIEKKEPIIIDRIGEIEKKLDEHFNSDESIEDKPIPIEPVAQEEVKIPEQITEVVVKPDVFKMVVPEEMVITSEEKPTPPPPKKDDGKMDIYEYFAQTKG